MFRFWKILYGVYYSAARLFWELPRGLDFLRPYYPRGAGTDSLYYQTATLRIVKKMLRGYMAPDARMLDMGCGKGYFIYCARKLGIRQVDGLEKDVGLAGIARENLKKSGMDESRVICADAKTFTGLDDYQVLYFFNPFVGHTMRMALQNIKKSLERKPRHLLIIYNNPAEYRLLDENEAFVLNEARTLNWLYRKVPVFYYIHENK